MDQGLTGGIDLLAQIADVRLEHPRIAPEVIAPYVIEQLRARKYSPRIEEQVAQEPVLCGRQLDRAPVPRHLARVLVELEVREGQPAGTLVEGAAAPQDVAQPGNEFLEAERLGDVIIPTRC